MRDELASTALEEESDSTLVAAAKNGEDRAFEILVKRYQARILSLAFRMTRNREDAQDVTQQSFQNAFVHLRTFEGKSSFPTWLTRIAINEALQVMRKNRSVRVLSLDDLDCEVSSTSSVAVSNRAANPEEDYVQRERERILSFVIDNLPPNLQAAVRLYLDDLSTREVGEILGIRIPTVKARLFRGRGVMGELFKRYMKTGGKRSITRLENAA
jgi:RNA polymerase sigma-70 factor (ECF subfamily)